MNANDSNDREMERLLEAHFASDADNVPPTPDLWVFLEDRLGDQAPKPLLAGIPRLGVSGRRIQWGAADCGHGSSSCGRHSDSRLGGVSWSAAVT